MDYSVAHSCSDSALWTLAILFSAFVPALIMIVLILSMVLQSINEKHYFVMLLALAHVYIAFILWMPGWSVTPAPLYQYEQLNNNNILI